MKIKVVHSQSKSAWNVVCTELGHRYKIARVPYVKCKDDNATSSEMYDALDIANFISKSLKTFNTKDK